MEESVETTTVTVEIQQRDGSVERTEVTETTTARSDSSEHGETTIENTTHVETVTQLEVPHQEMPHDSPPSSPERDLQDGFNTPTNALGIEVPITPPPPSPIRYDSSSSSRKRKSPGPDEEPEVDQVTRKQENGALKSPDSPTSPKKRKITPLNSPSMEEGAAAAEATYFPRTDGAFSSENASSLEAATASPESVSYNVVSSNEPSTPTLAEHTLASAPEDVTSSPKPATTSPPTSPAGSVKSSTSSTSSKKRKATWSEEDGEVTISPGGTRRAKRVQSSGVAVSKEMKEEGVVDGDGGAKISEREQVEIAVGLDDVKKLEAEDDVKSYDSLFHGSSQ